MIYRGRVENGVVVLEPGSRLREGMDVRVEAMPELPGGLPTESPVPDDVRQLRQGLLDFSGVVKDGACDQARNHDHYLHGMPRR